MGFVYSLGGEGYQRAKVQLCLCHLPRILPKHFRTSFLSQGLPLIKEITGPIPTPISFFHILSSLFTKSITTVKCFTCSPLCTQPVHIFYVCLLSRGMASIQRTFKSLTEWVSEKIVILVLSQLSSILLLLCRGTEFCSSSFPYQI